MDLSSDYSSKEIYKKISENKRYVKDTKTILIYNLVSPHFRLFLFSTIGLIVSSCVFLSLPNIFGKLIDKSLNQESLFNTKFAIFLLFLFIIGAFGFFIKSFGFNLISEKIKMRLRQKLFRCLVYKELSFFDSCKPGEFISRMNSDIALTGISFAGETMAKGIKSSIEIIVSISLMFYLSVRLTLIFVLVIPMCYFIGRFYGKYVVTLIRYAQDELAKASALLGESLSNILTVKGYCMEESEYNKYNSSVKNVYNSAMKYWIILGVFNSVTLLLGISAFSVVLFYGSKLCSERKIGVGSLTSIIAYGVYTGYAGIELSHFYSELMQGIGAYSRIYSLINGSLETDSPGITKIDNLKGDITFEKISFSYPYRKSDNVFENFSLTIPSLKTTVIVGTSGVGKSTIISLIQRFYSYESGSLSIDGHELTELSKRWLRSQIALVSQNVQLFSGSILENISFGKDQANQTLNHTNKVPKKIIEAAKAANAHDFIMNLPSNYFTNLENKSLSLSGGERQRIAFARAIYRDPKIFLFDEVTSALDVGNEKLILNSINNLKKKTILIITHNKNSIKLADQVVHLKSKKDRVVMTPKEYFEYESKMYHELMKEK